MIKLSLVTPVYNGARFLPAALDSIAAQRGDFELQHVVIDGGSTDGTLDILRAHESRFAYWHSRPDGGMYDALSEGFAHTDGEVMGWLNSDDVYFPWALDTVAQIFAALPEVDWLSTLSPAAIDESGHIFKMRKIAGFSRQAFIDGVYVGFDGLGNPYASDFIQQESTFWRRSLWERIGPDPLKRYRTDRRPAGDFALWAMFATEAELYGIETPLTAWRMHTAQWTDPPPYMVEVAHEMDDLRRKVKYFPPKFADNYAEYTGRYIVKAADAPMGHQWRVEESKFFVMPKSDLKKAIGLNRVF
jgi:glycosyltransferase involved in cell wall biosynthesis